MTQQRQKLYLLRHATAQDRHLGLPDAERQLIAKGERQSRRVAAWCQRHGLRPGRLLCSPLPRAQQTAALLAQHLHACPAPEAANWLCIHTPTAQALAQIGPLLGAGQPEAWLVGHEPDLSALIAALLCQTEPVLAPKKASLTCLALDAHSSAPGQLLWHLPCELMDV